MTCPSCASEVPALRDGLCLDCWYRSEDRPRPVRDRYAKLERLREIGVEPYAYSFEPSHDLTGARAAFEAAESGVAESATGAGDAADETAEVEGVRVAGRILSYRDLAGVRSPTSATATNASRSTSRRTCSGTRAPRSWRFSISATGSGSRGPSFALAGAR